MEHLKDKKGMTYMMVILILAIGSILVASMFNIALNESKQAIVQTDNMKAYNIARAGADVMVHRMLTLHRDYWNDFDTKHTTDPIDFKDGTFVVDVEKISTTEYEIISTGTYNDEKQVVKAVVELSVYSDWIYGIYAKKSIEDMQMGYLDTSIGSNGTINFKNDAYNTAYRKYADEYSLYTPFLPNYHFDLVESSILTNYQLNVEESIFVSDGGTVFKTERSSVFSSVEFNKDGDIWLIDTTSADFEREIVDAQNIDINFEGVANPNATGDWMILWIKGEDSVIKGDIKIIGDHNLMIVVEDKLEINGTLEYGYDEDGDGDEEHEFYGKVAICVIGVDTAENNIDLGYYDDTVDMENPPKDNSGAIDYDLILFNPNLIMGEADSVGKLTVNMWDSTQLNLDTNGDFYGFIFGPGAYVWIKNPTNIYGSVIADTIDLDANVMVYFDDGSDETPDPKPLMQFSYWD